MNTKKLTYSAMLTAIGAISSNLIYIPIGASKCFPIQHLINVIGAVTLGPFYGVAMAFCISLIRNILGTGTLLAFPGSMIGALLAGLIYKHTKATLPTVLGEIFGTGILGALAAYPLAAYVLGKKVALFAFILPFSVSTIGGSILAYLLIVVLQRTKVLKLI